MAFVVETGAGLETANSYLSVADADSYVADHGADATWTAATNDQKQEALRLATQFLDAKFKLMWRGVRTHRTQALAWPRSGIVDRDGYSVPSDSLPQALKDSCAELAVKQLADESLMPDQDNPGLIKSERVKVGPIEEETEYMGGKSQTKKYLLAEALLVDLILTSGRLERA